MSDLISRAEVHKTLSLLATEGGTDAKMLLSDAHEFIDALPSAESEQTVYCMDCAKSAPLDEHGALWYCKAHDRTTLRHSYCNNGERKGGDDE